MKQSYIEPDVWFIDPGKEDVLTLSTTDEIQHGDSVSWGDPTGF